MYGWDFWDGIMESPTLSCGMRCQVHLWRTWQTAAVANDLCRNNGKDLKDSCNSIFDHGNHSISARWKFILYDELCLGKTVAFILFIWAKTLLIAVAVAAGIMTASSVYGICASVWKYCKKEI